MLIHITNKSYQNYHTQQLVIQLIYLNYFNTDRTFNECVFKTVNTTNIYLSNFKTWCFKNKNYYYIQNLLALPSNLQYYVTFNTEFSFCYQIWSLQYEIYKSFYESNMRSLNAQYCFMISDLRFCPFLADNRVCLQI